MKKHPKTGKRYYEGITTAVVDINKGGYDDSHHLLELKVLPASVTELRRLLALPENYNIYTYAEQGTTFEDCVARIAMKLGIVLDGDYDGGELCEVLCNAIRGRSAPGYSNNPQFADSRLVSAEIVETEKELTLQVPEGPDIIEATAPVTPKLILPEEMN